MSRNTILEQTIIEKSKGQKPLKRTQFLIILNLQNEFASPDGKLPCNDLSFVNRIKHLVPKFREKVGGIIWVRTEYQADRQVNDGLEGSDTVVLSEHQDIDTVPVPEEPPKLSPILTTESSSGKKLKKKRSRFSFNIRNMTQSRRDSRDEKIHQNETESPVASLKPPPAPPGPEELFLAPNYPYERKCVPGTTGVDFVPEIKDLIQAVDTQITTSHYSATKGTNLLVFLQSKFAKEVYICGCISNLSIHATLTDMTGCAFDLRVIEDCLGFRTLQDHQVSLNDLLDERMTDVGSIESSKMHEDLDAPAGAEEARPDIVDSVSAMTIASNEGKEEPVVRNAARRTDPAPGLKANKVRMRPRGNPKPAASSREETLAATNRNAAIAEGSSPTNTTLPTDDEITKALAALQKTSASTRELEKPMLSADASAAVLAALGNLSVEDKTDVQSQEKPRIKSRSKKSKSKSKEGVMEPEGSKDFEGAPASSTQTTSDSLGSQLRSTITQNTTKIKKPSENRPSSTLNEQPPIDPTSPQPSSNSCIPQAVLDAPRSQQSNDGNDLLEKQSDQLKQTKGKAALLEERIEAEVAMEERALGPEAANPSDTSKDSIPTDRNTLNPGAVQRPTSSEKKVKLKSLANLPTLGPRDKIGEGDSTIRYDLLPPTIRDELDETIPLSDTIFTALYHEVQWQKMYHAAGEVPRLVAVQGAVSANGDKPIYRHPSDQAPPLLPFTKNVNIIRKEAEKIIGHELNHVLIQLYRDGKDFISEHSDKTLDIMPGSKIVNASFGASRTMRLRTKKSGFESEDSTRQTQRIPMPHNSLFALGLISNKIWLHGVNPDKRLQTERSPEELAYNGKRISLTFRYIGTFLDKEENLIWGQGAVGRSRDEARSVVNGNEVETEKMIQAFSKENREGAGFVWREAYGCGFDVLHFRDKEEGSQ